MGILSRNKTFFWDKNDALDSQAPRNKQKMTFGKNKSNFEKYFDFRLRGSLDLEIKEISS